ncbi:MAG: acetyl-CoA carboxylase biotin carboxylase subunit, partial [Ilumatobacteraceae bacterium]
MFESVLIANRGEIAVRVARTLRALGIRSIAVYSDADARARHVAVADTSVHIGPAAALDSYLSVERIIDAAVRSGAQALHPGYGFLSENVALAAACAEAGIVFVGPPVSAIEAMGDKIRAKRTVAANGVAVVPGIEGVGLSSDELVIAAREVGLPALIKPSAGGGGKGMRLVTSHDDWATAIAGAQREARASFGDDTLLIERYIQRPRHIEVQVLADAHGGVVHLGERECSLQRRHQKVIEEAPSPYLTDERRAALGAQAVAAARACGYVNAGTVEFVVSGEHPDEAFFLEMNTRLQVEHPVTEMVWGIDLVEQQLRIAAGEQLGFTQSDLAPRGHAIEARVYAEDPATGFLPTGGTVELLREPAGREHVRVDSSLLAGAVVGSDYDPMLAKVIAWGTDRDSARRRLDAALAETTVLGLTTNVAFLRELLVDPSVVKGTIDTGLIDRLVASRPAPAMPTVAVVAASLAMLGPTAGGGGPAA